MLKGVGRLMGAAKLVESSPAAVPVNSVLPSISGFPSPGSKQTIDIGEWSNSPASYTVVVKKGGATYATLTSAPWEYTPVLADGGATFTAEVTATNDAGSSAPAISANKPIVANAWACWNPKNTSTITISSGSDVSALADTTGNGRNATSSSNRPTTGANINGANALLFDGVNDVFTVPTNPATGSLFAVIQMNSAANAPNVSMTLLAGSSSGHMPIAQDGSATTTVVLNAGTPTLWINGEQITPANRNELFDLMYNSGQPILFEAHGYTGTNLNRIALGVSNSCFGGKMGRWFIMSGTPTADELTEIRREASQEWGLGFFNPDPGGGTGDAVTSGDGTALTWGDGSTINWSGSNA